jgi:hypothetical protein
MSEVEVAEAKAQRSALLDRERSGGEKPSAHCSKVNRIPALTQSLPWSRSQCSKRRSADRTIGVPPRFG